GRRGSSGGRTRRRRSTIGSRLGGGRGGSRSGDRRGQGRERGRLCRLGSPRGRRVGRAYPCRRGWGGRLRFPGRGTGKRTGEGERRGIGRGAWRGFGRIAPGLVKFKSIRLLSEGVWKHKTPELCSLKGRSRHFLLLVRMRLNWLRGLDLNQRPQGYEPCELPGCSTPQKDSSSFSPANQAIIPP